MKKNRIVIILFCLLLSLFSFAQTDNHAQIQIINGNKFILHQVNAGETIFSICKQYDIDQKELLKANSSLVAGLKQNETIRIPLSGKNVSKEVLKAQQVLNSAYTMHLVKKSETVYSISKIYNIVEKDIYKLNPEAEKGIKEKDVLRLPKSGSNLASQVSQNKIEKLEQNDENNFIYHKVLSGESKFGLSKKYNVTVEEIERYNPETVPSLESGITIKIPKNNVGQKEENDNNSSLLQKYTINKGDTFSSLKRKFGVSKDELIKLNPTLSDGLKVGFVISIPSTNKSNKNKPNDVIGKANTHVVQKGQTFFSISQIYGISVDDLVNANPAIKGNSLKNGDILQLPKPVEVKQIAEPEKVQEKKPEPLPEKAEMVVKGKSKDDKGLITRKDVFRISMFLPLYINKNLASTSEEHTIGGAGNNTSDSVLVNLNRFRSEKTVHPDSKNFLEFYEGVLIAVDSLQKAGAKIELTVYDSELSAKKVDAQMQNSKLANSNLIIGPVDVSLQKNVAAFCYKNQIPMISPFSPDNSIVVSNPFYVQINPNKDYVIKKTADFVIENFKKDNIVIVNHWGSDKVKEARLAELLREKHNGSNYFMSFKSVDYGAGGNAGTDNLRTVLKKDMDNVIIIPATEKRDERETFISRVVNSLQVLAKDYSITLVGLSDYPRSKSINTENFHLLNLHYLTPNHINYNDQAVKSFIRKYRKQFAAEPSVYSFRGYDITWYFVRAFNKYGKNYFDNISSFDTNLLMNDFDFKRVKEFAGYMNSSLFIINLNPQFDVKVDYKYSEGKLVKTNFELNGN